MLSAKSYSLGILITSSLFLTFSSVPQFTCSKRASANRSLQSRGRLREKNFKAEDDHYRRMRSRSTSHRLRRDSHSNSVEDRRKSHSSTSTSSTTPPTTHRRAQRSSDVIHKDKKERYGVPIKDMEKMNKKVGSITRDIADLQRERVAVRKAHGGLYGIEEPSERRKTVLEWKKYEESKKDPEYYKKTDPEYYKKTHEKKKDPHRRVANRRSRAPSSSSLSTDFSSTFSLSSSDWLSSSEDSSSSDLSEESDNFSNHQSVHHYHHLYHNPVTNPIPAVTTIQTPHEKMNFPEEAAAGAAALGRRVMPPPPPPPAQYAWSSDVERGTLGPNVSAIPNVSSTIPNASSIPAAYYQTGVNNRAPYLMKCEPVLTEAPALGVGCTCGKKKSKKQNKESLGHGPNYCHYCCADKAVHPYYNYKTGTTGHGCGARGLQLERVAQDQLELSSDLYRRILKYKQRTRLSGGSREFDTEVGKFLAQQNHWHLRMIDWLDKRGYK